MDITIIKHNMEIKQQKMGIIMMQIDTVDKLNMRITIEDNI